MAFSFGVPLQEWSGLSDSVKDFFGHSAVVVTAEGLTVLKVLHAWLLYFSVEKYFLHQGACPTVPQINTRQARFNFFSSTLDLVCFSFFFSSSQLYSVSLCRVCLHTFKGRHLNVFMCISMYQYCIQYLLNFSRKKPRHTVLSACSGMMNMPQSKCWLVRKFMT